MRLSPRLLLAAVLTVGPTSLLLPAAADETQTAETATAEPAAAQSAAEQAALPPVGEALSVKALEAELIKRVEELGTHVADEEAFEAASEMKWNKACGVIACIGQALSQHPEGHTAKGDKLAIRDAALALAEAGDAEEAKGLLDPLGEAMTVPGTVYVDSPDAAEPSGDDWYSLIESYYLMQEINDRNAALVKIMRRPRGTAEEAANAAVMALLCYPMHAQAEDYVEEEDLAGYRMLTVENLTAAGELAETILKRDRRGVKAGVLATQKSCQQCHKQYRDGE